MDEHPAPDADDRPDVSRRRPGRKAGYAAAAVANGVVLFVVHNLLGWGWPPFLTDEFTRLLPLIDVSLGATILVNVVYLSYDPARFRSLCQIVLNGISMAVAVRTYLVFPFDFSPYEFDWATVARVLLVLSMVGIAIATIVEAVKLTTGSSDT